MGNNDVIIEFYYYIFLHIIDLCTKCRQKGKHSRAVLAWALLAFLGGRL